jgi:uncharacterized membrane protein
MLKQYDDVFPGLAERIVKMAESQVAHRQELEKIAVRGDSQRAFLGLLAGFVVIMSITGGGIYLIASGHGWVGASLIGMGNAGLVSAFIYGTASRRRERAQKAAAVTQMTPRP